MDSRKIRGVVIWSILVIVLVSIFLSLQFFALTTQHKALKDSYSPNVEVIFEPLYTPPSN